MDSKPEPTVTRIDPQTIPPETTVRHFDELDVEAKDSLLALLDEQSLDATESVNIEALTSDGVIKFVDYYDVDRPEISIAD